MSRTVADDPLPTETDAVPDYAALVASAHAAADASGAELRPRFRRGTTTDNKAAAGTIGAAAFDPVTDADRAAERTIRRVLEARHPDHGLLGEEYGATRPDARFRWVVDPIDGTRAFIVGLPTWGTLIGLTDSGRPVLGLMDQPYTGERAWADGHHSHWRAADGTVERMRTRSCDDLGHALAMTTSPDLFVSPVERAVFESVRSSVRMMRYGGDCYAYAMLAAGHVDIVIETGLQPYDIVAMIPIIERAGGRVTSWDGGDAAGGGRVLATGDPRLHAELLDRLAALDYRER